MLTLATKNRPFGKNLVHHGKILLTLRVQRSTESYSNDEYQYIQKSNMPTTYFQKSLPRLHIPKLQDTCKRYLNAQEPLLSSTEFADTKNCTVDFMALQGQELQNILVERNKINAHTSYISEPWFNMYLRDRRALPINSNPVLTFKQEADPKYNDQLVKATNLVISALRFMRSLTENILKPEIFYLNPKVSDSVMYHLVTKLLPSRIKAYGSYAFKAFPLDMSQYPNLFNTTRIPRNEKDQIFQDKSAKHLIVMRKGHFYSFDVLDENGYIRKPMEIASCLNFILNDNVSTNKHPIGLFTTMDRDEWAAEREHLQSIGNAELLKKIDSAIFSMILDDNILGDDLNGLVRSFLHSDGTNRWFDKSLSLIVSKDGYSAINFEHSWGDGVAVLRFFRDVKADISNKPQFHPEDVNHLSGQKVDVQKHEIIADNRTESVLSNVKNRYKEWTESLYVDHMISELFGKKKCKRISVSPDAIMQLAFQLAYFNLYGKVVSTYESCSTAVFKHGRTETIRPCTMQMKELCIAISNETVPVYNLRKMIIEFGKTHTKLTKEAAMGQGFDRHLFVLREIQKELSNIITTPSLFLDPAFEKLNTNILSTSTLADNNVIAGGFGPVVNQGFGIGYMIQDERLGAVITSYKNQYTANDFAKSLRSAVITIHKIMMGRLC